MKKMLFILPILVALFFVGCSSDGDGEPGGNNGNKVLSEIVINEHEKKFGEINEYGELYANSISIIQTEHCKKKPPITIMLYWMVESIAITNMNTTTKSV